MYIMSPIQPAQSNTNGRVCPQNSIIHTTEPVAKSNSQHQVQYDKRLITWNYLISSYESKNRKKGKTCQHRVE